MPLASTPADLVRDGLRLREAGRFAEALAALEAAAAAGAGDRFARLAAGECLRELGRADEAHARFAALVAEEPAFARAQLALGHTLRRLGRRAEARAAFEAARALEPANPWPRLALAEETLDAGDLAAAGAEAARFVADAPAFLLAHAFAGRVARASGDGPAAIEAFGRAVALDPNAPWPLVWRAGAFAAAGRLEEARADYRAALALDPRLAQAEHEFGQLERGAGRLEAAFAHFAAAAALNPANPWHATSQASTAAALGRSGEAIALLESVLAARPAFAPAHAELAKARWGRGDVDGALAALRAASAAEPGNPWRRHELAMRLREAGAGEEAHALLLELRTAAPGFAPAARLLGESHAERGDPGEAHRAFAEAAALDPGNPWFAAAVAASHRARGRAAEALAEAEALCARFPDAVAPRVERAHALRALGRWREAAAQTEAARALDPRNVALMAQLAADRLRLGRIDEAEALYAEAGAHDPGFRDAEVGLALAARARGDHAGALRRFEEAARPGAPAHAVVEYANELLAALRPDAAAAAVAGALGERPRERSLLLARGRIERARGDFAAAARAHADAAAAHPRWAAAHAERARDLLRVRRVAEGLDALKTALRIDPADPAALSALAEALILADRTDDALRVLSAGEARAPWVGAKLAHLEASLGDIDAALARLDRADAAAGVSAETASARAFAYAEARLYERACDVLADAIERFPGAEFLKRQIVSALIDVGDFDAARAWLDRAAAAAPRDAAEAQWLRARLAFARSDFAEAFDLAEAAIAADDGDPARHDFAARCALLDFDVAAAERRLNGYAERRGAETDFRGVSRRGLETHLGQMLEEWRIDGAALTAARAARAQPPEARIGALASVVRAYPDYTPAAIALLTEARRLGRLRGAARAQRIDGRRIIPPLITQFWDGPQPPRDVATLMDGWRAMNAGFAHRLFDLEGAAAYLDKKLPAPVGMAFRRAREPAQKADLFRLAVLAVDGGYYADADDRCVAPIASIDPGDRPLILYQEDIGSVGNDFLGAAPGHRVVLGALSEAVASVNAGGADMLWLLSGPGLLTRALAREAVRDVDAFLDGERSPLVLTRFELFRAVRIHCAASYKHGARHWSRSAFAATRGAHGDALDELCALAAQEPR